MNRRIAWLLTLIILCPLLALAAPVAIMPEAEPFGADDDVLHLYVLDLVSADCMLLQYRRQNLLIDLGRTSQFVQLQVLLDHLSVREAAVFNSHPHGDHIGGIFKLTDICKVSTFYTCFPEDETEPRSVQRPAMKHLASAGVPVQRLEDGDKVPFEGLDLSVHQHFKAVILNDRSAMLHLRFHEATLLLSADVSVAAQTFFSKRKGLSADIMKAPHHGVEPILGCFLRAVQPKYVFITHGSGDGRQTQGDLRRLGLPHHYATRGIIHLMTDGKRWVVEQIPKAGYTLSQPPGQSTEKTGNPLL